MAEKKKTVAKSEREYTIPLRDKCRPVPRYKKTNKAVKTVKEFLAQHMKIRDRDLKKIKIASDLNEFLWARGIRSPPHKVKVKASKEGDIVTVSLVDVPKKIGAKKARTEKREAKAKEAGEKKKSVMQKMTEKPKAKKEHSKEELERSIAEVEETPTKQEVHGEEEAKVKDHRAMPGDKAAL